jgi:alpha-2-macroglobulin
MKARSPRQNGLVSRYRALALRITSPFAKLFGKARAGLSAIAGKGVRRIIVYSLMGAVLAAGLGLALFMIPSAGPQSALTDKPEESFGILMPIEDESEPDYEAPLGEGRIEFIGPDEDNSEYGYGGAYGGEGEYEGDGDGGYYGILTALIPPARKSDPIRIRFASDVGSPNGRNAFPDKDSAVVVEFDPPIKGEYEWQSSRELRIYPAPGSLSANGEIKYSIYSRNGGSFIASNQGSFASEQSYGGDKGGDSSLLAGIFSVGEFNGQAIQAGRPSAITLLNGDSDLIAEDGAYVLFDQPVKPGSVKGYAEKNGRKSKMTLEEVESIPMDEDGLIDPEYVLFARFASPMPANAPLTLSFAPSAAPSDLHDFNVTVAPPLAWRIDGLEEGNKNEYVDLQSEFAIRFTSPVKLDDIRNAVSLETEGADGRASFYQAGGDIMVSLSLDYGGQYSLSISGNFTDDLGRGFTEEQKSYSFRARDKAPELYLPTAAVVLEEGQDRLPIRARNPGPITLSISRYKSAADFIRAMNGEETNDLFPAKEIKADIDESDVESYRNEIMRTDVGIDGAPGLKRVEVSIEGAGSEAPYPITKSVLVQTTGIALSTKVWNGKVMVWAVDMGKSKPLAGLPAKVYSAGFVIGEGKTDADGTAVIDADIDFESPYYVSVEKGKDIAIARLGDEDLSKAWQFNLPGGDEAAAVLPVALFTERGAYRPGETVNFKAFLRPGERENPGFVGFSIKDQRGSEIYQATKELDAFMGADGSYDLGPSAGSGEYILEADVDGVSRLCSFRVEEYRLPTFAVKIDSQAAFRPGEQVSATVSAEYLRGGSLDGRDMEWRVYRQPEMYRNASYPEYIFGLYPGASMTGTVARGEAKLDGTGKATIEFTPDHPAEEGQMRYIVEASVQDVDRQTYAGRASRLMSVGRLRVGLKPQRKALYREGSVLRMPFVVLDADGKPVSGKDVIVQLNQVDYHTTTMEGLDGETQTYNRDVIAEQTLGKVISGSGPKDLSVKVSGSGTWQLKLIAKDERGNVAATEFLFSSYGESSSAWPRFDRERIELIADKEEYAVGDTIRVMAQNPYKSVIGLLTVETDGVISRKVVRSSGDNPAYEIPVTEDMAPNAYVSLTLVRPREHSEADGTGFQTGAPGYKIGYAKVKVIPTGKKLELTISDNQASSSAGQRYDFTVNARDSKGAPVDASVCVMVVDEAALSLTGYRTPDPISLAYVARRLGVRNGSNILDMPHSRRIRNDPLFPGGDSDIEALIAAAERQEKRDLVRKLFKSTAYWDPDLKLGSDGSERVSVSLPDNLTAYRIMVVAVDKKGAMGSGEASFVCQRALTIQPALPRFAYPGDAFNLDVMAANSSGADGVVALAPQFKGLSSAKAGTESKDVKAGGEAVFSYPVTVGKGESATVAFKASLGQDRDAIELSLPIRRMEYRIRRSASGYLGGASTFDIPVNKNFLPGSLEVEAVVAATPLATLQDALDMLLEYPHGCIEQTSSRAYPLVVLGDIIPLFGKDIDEAALKDMAAAGVARIHTFATQSGGLSYWPGGRDPHAYGSVVGLNILAEAKKRGFAVDEGTMQRLIEWVEWAAGNGKEGDPNDAIHMNDETAAYAAYVLGLAGRPQPGLIEAMWRSETTHSVFAKASLAMAAAGIPSLKGLAAEIGKDLRSKVMPSLKDIAAGKTSYDEWSMGSSVRDVAALALAFHALDPKAKEIESLTEKLLEMQAGSRWYSTQDNVFAIMALSRVFASPGANRPHDGSISLNGKKIAFADMKDQAGGGCVVKLGEKDLGALNGRLSLRVDAPDGLKRFASLKASWLVAADDKTVSKQSEGYALERTYETMQGKSLTGKVLPLGELVRIRLKVRASKEKTYFALTDYLPAGLEPVNASLETTGKDEAADRLSADAKKTLPLISYRDMRDWGVSFYADRLPAGSYEFVYFARATVSGDFRNPQAVAEAMYEPYFRGTTEPGRASVR